MAFNPQLHAPMVGRNPSRIIFEGFCSSVMGRDSVTHYFVPMVGLRPNSFGRFLYSCGSSTHLVGRSPRSIRPNFRGAKTIAR